VTADADAPSDVAEPATDDPAATASTTVPRRTRGATLPVVAIIVAVAVVAATATVVWARLPVSAPQADPAQEVPTTLGDERRLPEAPAAVAGAIGLPVLMAQRVDDTTDLAARCETDPQTVLGSHITPGHATVLARTDRPPAGAEIMADPAAGGPLNVGCVLRWSDGTWERIGLAATPTRGPDAQFPAWMCCDPDGESFTFTVLHVSRDVAWLLEDRGHYAVAYDVAGLDATGVVASVTDMGQEVGTHVWWLDGDGVIIGEAYGNG
jgi:hypothetical protein